MATIQIFRAGRHTANSGQTLAFSDGDLEAAAKAYDPKKHEAPLVVGHPTTNAPAYGWVKSIEYSDGLLSAEPQQVDPEFQEMVKAGRFKKISASFYLPDSPQNPAPGSFYLRHVGFLGAQPPAVKGLKDAAFADSEVGVVSFDEDGLERGSIRLDLDVARIISGLREWLIGKFGLEEANTALPGWEVRCLENQAREAKQEAEAEEPEPGNYSENGMNPELEKKAAELAAREEALAARELATKNAGALAFAEGLVKEGRVAPVHAKGLAALLVQVDGADSGPRSGEALPGASAGGGAPRTPGSVLSFGEGEVTAVDWLKGFLGSLPKQVTFAETAKAGPAPDEPATVDFTTPEGCEANPETLAIHSKAKAYQRAHPGVDYATAVCAVWL